MRHIVAVLLPRVALAGCPRPSPGPMPLPGDSELQGTCEAVTVACETAPTEALCDAAEACAVVLHASEFFRADLDECRSLAAVNVGEQAELRRQAEVRVEALEGQRWVWGAVGVALGAVVVGLAVGLGR